MRHKIISLCCLLAFITACSNDDPETEPVTEEARTVLIYIAAENSLYNMVEADMEEIKKGMSGVDADCNNLLVYIDDRSAPRLLRIVPRPGKEAAEEIIAEYDEQNSASSSVMKSVIGTAFTRFPAASNGLVLWSHGEGWIQPPATSRWWGMDNGQNTNSNTGNCMDIADLGEALRSAPHLDFILFDACFMESVEVAYALRDRCDYLIGSPAEIPGPGAPYDAVVPALFKREGTPAGIAESYFNPYAAKYNGGKNNANTNWTAGVSIGMLKTGELENLAAATAGVLPKYITGRQAPACGEVMCYDSRSSSRYYHDLDRFIHGLTGGNSDYTSWKAAFDKAMVYWETTATNYSSFGTGSIDMDPDAGGLSTFIPRDEPAGLIGFYHTLEWYAAAGWNQTGW